jgi:hypothetical protein
LVAISFASELAAAARRSGDGSARLSLDSLMASSLGKARIAGDRD